jgi:hypothetical protein
MRPSVTRGWRESARGGGGGGGGAGGAGKGRGIAGLVSLSLAALAANLTADFGSKSDRKTRVSLSCSHAMRMRVLAAFATSHSLHDLLLNETLLSLFSFILPLPAFSRGSSALAACHWATPWTPISLCVLGGSLSLGDALDPHLPLRPWGIMACTFIAAETPQGPQCTGSGATPSLTTSRHFLSTPHISCGFFRSHLLVICAAKLCYTAAAAREHRRVLAPRLPGASVTSPLHTPLSPPTTHPECSPGPLVPWILKMAP